MDAHLLAPAGGHGELVVRVHGHEHAELGHEQHRHDDRRHQRDHPAAQRPLEKVLVHLGERVETLERTHEPDAARGGRTATLSHHATPRFVSATAPR